MLQQGQMAPFFEAVNDKNEKISLDDLKGKYTVLYFYPKAFTPGCTKESCNFADRIDDFSGVEIERLEKNANNLKFEAQILGVSPDKPETQAKFKKKYNLQFDLLSDPEREVASAFYALKENGKSILRSTFILDRWGRIRKAWYGVKVKGHVEEVYNSLKKVMLKDFSLNSQISTRRASRALSREKISREELKRFMEAAHLAPSCMNNQPWRFTIIDDEELLAEVHEGLAKGNYWMKDAPVLVAVHSKPEFDCRIKGREYYLFDTGLAVGFLLIQATQMGMVAHPVAGYNEDKVKEILGLEEEQLITIIAIAYPGEDHNLSDKHKEIEKSDRERVELKEVITWNR